MSTPGQRSAQSFAAVNAWRSHPLLKYSLRSAVPGFGLGFSAFVVYCVGEKAYGLASGKKDDAHGHGGHGHAAAHH